MATYQSFDVTSDPSNGPARLALLRAELDARGLDGFLVPRADEHQGEYVAPGSERLAWLTGFTGSAGIAATLGDKAALFVDGRYTIQAADQVDASAFEVLHLIEHGLDRWLGDNLAAGQKLGYDPWLHTLAGRRKLQKVAEKAGAELVAVEANPLDAVWSDRPGPPTAPVHIHPPELAGRDTVDKLTDIAEALAENDVDVSVITQPDALAWIFNIRGGDLPHVPVTLGFAVLGREGRPDVFLDPAKLSNEVRAHIETYATIHPRNAFGGHLAKLGERAARVLLSPQVGASAIHDAIVEAGGTIVEGAEPTDMLKAIKNEAEQAGARAAHERDGVAMVRFLAWLNREALSGGCDEIAAAQKLEALRAETGALRDISFDTISGVGPNGAIVHYRVTTATNRSFAPNTLYLVDSGAQYCDGTTDITRTVALGTPSADMRRAYTLVLKGHLAIGDLRFPDGTTGAQIDALARQFLWQAGLDYDHGTGHGVGSYLSVHEGPASISKRGATTLQPGMILSNEPGYYRTGAFGIRIENLVLIGEPEDVPGGDKQMLSFETLTLAPYDRRLIDTGVLSAHERDLVDAYHTRVRETLSDQLNDTDRAWLEAATAPL